MVQVMTIILFLPQKERRTSKLEGIEERLIEETE
jgi:hypothetical protein